jgi:hypothetical protein
MILENPQRFKDEASDLTTEIYLNGLEGVAINETDNYSDEVRTGNVSDRVSWIFPAQHPIELSKPPGHFVPGSDPLPKPCSIHN